ncbi:S41 family peptidase [Sphingomonas sp. IC4-52]|uniref:S41 family peptidase n=1 Tax=Sphingomonas sp. IC4-52 TaxID=2887202 RepID=UPI001D1132CA|nr:S41 family peptidase [Sphingomonas sp. IC4-52]MCC2980902.1 peptidase S41 [Sphingomonas sp. IC4-52]
MSLLAGCGGDGGGSSSGTPIANSPSPTSTPTSVAGCSLQDRKAWAAAELREWYLFPDTLPTSLDPAPFASVDDYIDAMTATARAQNKDRYFTYLTSIAEENAYYDSGSSAGYGFRLGINASVGRMFVIEAFEGTPALEAGLDRGTEIVAIGQPGGTLRTVSALFADGGAQAVSNALGGSTAGVARVLRVRALSGSEREVTLTPRDFELSPVSSRYGIKILEDGGRRVGYINLRTFISTADQPLRDGFGQLRAAGITELIVDLRYNGGGLLSTARLMNNLLGGNRQTSDVLGYTTFRREKSSENSTDYFLPQPQSVSPTKIAFIGTQGTASASEVVINAMIPYLRGNVALIGTNTYGKPVGQTARDKPACDDRLRVVALTTQNADRQGDYYNGLAPFMPATCEAVDDLSYQLGDPREASVQQALAFLNGRSCTRIGGAAATASAARVRNVAVKQALLTPMRPSTIQRETPGAF